MRIESLRLRDFLRHADTKVDFGGVPVALLVGPNGAGKSSVVDAVRWALLNSARGLSARDNKALVRRGADTCKVELSIRHADQVIGVSRTPSAGTPSQESIRAALGIPDDSALQAALEAGRFLELSPKERKVIVFRLAGAEVGEATLREHGIDDPEAIRLALSKGFDAAEKHATEKKRVASRTADAIPLAAPVDDQVETNNGPTPVSSITGVTAEAALHTIRGLRDVKQAALTRAQAALDAAATAGHRVAEAQQALTVAERELAAFESRCAGITREDPNTLRLQAEELVAKINAPAPAVGLPYPEAAVSRHAQAQTAYHAADARLKQVAAAPWRGVEAIAAKVAALPGGADPAKELRELAQAQGGDPIAAQATFDEAVRVLLESDLRRQGAVAAYQKSKDDAAQAHAAHAFGVSNLKKDRLTLLERANAIQSEISVEGHTRVRLQAAVASAKSRIEEASKAATPPAVDMAALQADLEKGEWRLARAEEIVRKVRTYNEAAGRYAQDVERVNALRAEAERFDRMEKALRPSGVMAQLVSAPLAKIREVLAKVSAPMLAKEVRLTDEWEVLYGEAPVSLASTSERWRVGAALAIAVGAVSGLRWAVLDEASVCVGHARNHVTEAILGAREYFDQVVIVASRSEAEMATLAPPPPELASAVGIWRVDAGTVARLSPAAVTAAA